MNQHHQALTLSLLKVKWGGCSNHPAACLNNCRSDPISTGDIFGWDYFLKGQRPHPKTQRLTKQQIINWGSSDKQVWPPSELCWHGIINSSFGMGASHKELCVVFLTNDTSYRCHVMAGKFLVLLQNNRKKKSCPLPKILALMVQS